MFYIMVQNYMNFVEGFYNNVSFSWRIKDYLEELWVQVQYIIGVEGEFRYVVEWDTFWQEESLLFRRELVIFILRFLDSQGIGFRRCFIKFFLVVVSDQNGMFLFELSFSVFFELRGVLFCCRIYVKQFGYWRFRKISDNIMFLEKLFVIYDIIFLEFNYSIVFKKIQVKFLKMNLFFQVSILLFCLNKFEVVCFLREEYFFF